MKKIKSFLSSLKFTWIFFLAILVVHILLRTYKIDVYNTYGWDQVDNAWASVNILIHHKMPLVGMVAKQNSGMYIGPAYYYLIALFYFFFNLDPIASGVFAVITSVAGFLTIYFVAKKIFPKPVAYIAIFINAVSFASIYFDRIQWPVNLIPVVSLLIFYFLYKTVTGNPKYIFYLALAIGFSFHIHFTSIFYPLIVFLSLPFFPWSWKTVKIILLSIPLFFIWLIPNIIAHMQIKNAHSNSFISYGSTYYHGFHIRRVLQLAKDAFIQFEPFLFFPVIKFLKYLLLPVFSIVIFKDLKNKQGMMLVYLFWLWFIVPWFVFSTYSGEISDYYFSVNRYFVILILSYIIYLFFNLKTVFPKILVAIALTAYGIFCIQSYFIPAPIGGIADKKQKIKSEIQAGTKVEFMEGNPESYIYYIWTRKK